MARTDENEAKRPRAVMDTATIEVNKELRKTYKLAAVEMDTTMRALAEEALRAYLPQLQKRRSRKAS